MSLTLQSITRLLAIGVILPSAYEAAAQHRVLLQGNDRLAIVDTGGEIEWEMPWGGIHDVHMLENGHIMIQRNFREVVEIDPASKEVVWSYDAANSNGNSGKKVEVHAFQPLENGNIMIAESGPARIIEIDRGGNLLNEVKLKVDNPHPHRDTRLARKIANGNYLVCHEGDGAVREYDSESGEVVWEFEVPLFDREPKPGHGPEAWGNQVFSALRLPNGRTLVGTGNGHSILEVTSEGRVAGSIQQSELPGITLAWVTTLEMLENGNFVIGNCHAGPGQPLIIELDGKTLEVVWTLDEFETFGNSVSNSLLIDERATSLR